MQHQTIKLTKSPEYSFREDGTFSFVTRDSGLLKLVCDIYGRTTDKKILRIFHRPLAPTETLDTYVWGKLLGDKKFTSILVDTVKVQNVMHFKGLAPRVYAMFVLEIDGMSFPSLLMDDVGNETMAENNPEIRERVYNRVKAECEAEGIVPPFGDLDTPGNVIGRVWVDWQGAGFTEAYRDGLKNKVQAGGMFGDGFYQSIPEFNLEGYRDTDKRPAELGFDQIDFNGKTVHDCGCSSGMLAIEAIRRGAKRVVGTDHGHVVDATRELVNYMGYFNIDFYQMDINKDQTGFCDIAEFDITLFLSMYRHVLLPNWVVSSTKTMILELNKPDNMTEDEALTDIKSKFEDVVTVGRNTDFHNRLVLFLSKPKLD